MRRRSRRCRSCRHRSSSRISRSCGPRAGARRGRVEEHVWLTPARRRRHRERPPSAASAQRPGPTRRRGRRARRGCRSPSASRRTLPTVRNWCVVVMPGAGRAVAEIPRVRARRRARGAAVGGGRRIEGRRVWITCGAAGVNVNAATRFGLVGRMMPCGTSRMSIWRANLAAEVAGVHRRDDDRHRLRRPDRPPASTPAAPCSELRRRRDRRLGARGVP